MSLNANENSKILTKNTNRGFQIRKLQKNTAEQEKAIREQLHVEIETKTKACSNIVYDCTLPRIDGYEYCLKHILQDPKAPFKQCTYQYPTNGKRCTQPAPKYDPKKDVFTSFCFEHSRLSQLTKTRNSIGKLKTIESNETLLSQLSHHVNVVESPEKSLKSIAYGNHTITTNALDSSESDVDTSARSYGDPFVDVETVAKKQPNRHILDYASNSSSDDDEPTALNTWKGLDMDCSDDDSVDSQNEDLLKHAEIYTTEEATSIAKQKMMRLQTLYIDQVHRLKYLLREKRRQYLQTLKQERETLCSIHDQSKDTFAERQMYAKLKALNKFHKRHGTEAILHRKSLDKRTKTLEGYATQRTSFHNKCIFSEGGVKCGDRIIPCSKYCRKHILEDKKQILFQPCNVEKGGVVCKESVPFIFDDSTCALHIELPPQRTYTQKKVESESEDEDVSTATNRSLSMTEKMILASALNIHSPLIGLKSETDDQQQSSSIPPASNLPPTELLQNQDFEMFSAEEEVGTNVTICHDDGEVSSSVVQQQQQ